MKLQNLLLLVMFASSCVNATLKPTEERRGLKRHLEETMPEPVIVLPPLIAAVEQDNAVAVAQLLALPMIDVNVVDADGDTALIIAAEKGNLEIVNLLLAVDNIAVNAADSDGQTALLLAADEGHVAIVNRFLENNEIDVNASSEKGFTPLMGAVRRGSLEIVTRLLAMPGIDVNKQYENGESALIGAVRLNNIDLARILLEHGADFRVSTIAKLQGTAHRFNLFEYAVKAIPVHFDTAENPYAMAELLIQAYERQGMRADVKTALGYVTSLVQTPATQSFVRFLRTHGA